MSSKKSVTHQKNYELFVKLATLCSVLVALVIISLKISAWIITDSLSLLSSLVDSMIDVFASIMTFIAVRYSLKPADDDHRFGHSGAEDIAAFAQGTFIAGSGLFILFESVSRFINPRQIEHAEIGIVVMVISTFLTIALITFQSFVIKRTNSSAIKADSMHYKMDLLVNIMVIGSFTATKFTDIHLIDPLIALMIAFYILYGAWKVGKAAFDNLMDKEFSDEDRNKIMDAIFEHPEAKAIHDLRTRSSGRIPFIQFHLELDSDLSLKSAHVISHQIESKINLIFPQAEIIIHEDIESDENISLQMSRVVAANYKS